MATPNNNFQISFSIDLKPFAEGLKSALSMTAATGQQIKPLLNFEITAPDFTGIQSIMDNYEASLRSIKEAQTSLNPAEPFNVVPPKIKPATDALIDHEKSLKGAKKESLEMFGAISFAAQSIVMLGQNADKGNEQLEKLSHGLSEGISAGFGLSSVISLIAPEMGMLSLAMGGATALGLTFANMMGEGARKATDWKNVVEQLQLSLRGFSISQIKNLRDINAQEISFAEKSLNSAKYNQELYEKKGTQDRESITMAKHYKEEVERLTKELDGLRKAQQKLDEAFNSQQLQRGEVAKVAQEAEKRAITDKYVRERNEAIETFNKQKEIIENSNITGIDAEEFKSNAIKKLRVALNAELTAIDKQKNDDDLAFEKELENTQRQIRNEELQYEKMIAGIRNETTKAYIEAEKIKELASNKSAVARLAIEEKYAIKIIDLEETSALAYAQTEEEKTEIMRRAAAQRQLIRAQTNAAFTDAQKQDVDTAKEAHEKLRRQWSETHQIELAFMRGITEGFQNMWKNILLTDRDSRNIMIARQENDFELFKIDKKKQQEELKQQLQNNEISRREYDLRMRSLDLEEDERQQQLSEAKKGYFAEAADAIKTVTIQALGEVIAKQIELTAIDIGLEQSKQAASAATGVTKTAEGAAALPFPANLIAIPIAIAAAMTLFGGIKGAFGFAEGGRLPRGKSGYVEGWHNEIIAPEQTFTKIMRDEFIPRQVAEAGGIPGYSGSNKLEKRIEELTKAISKMPSRVEMKQKGNDEFYGVWQSSEKDYNNKLL